MYIVMKDNMYLKLFSNEGWTESIQETPKYTIEQIADEIAKKVNGVVAKVYNRLDLVKSKIESCNKLLIEIESDNELMFLKPEVEKDLNYWRSELNKLEGNK